MSVDIDREESRRLAGRLRFASLPTEARLDTFDLVLAQGIDLSLLNEPGTCRWIETATNVLLIDPPGVRKTHLARAWGGQRGAGYRVHFASAAELAARCHKAAIDGHWSSTMRYFAGPTLLIIDELGTLPLPGRRLRPCSR